MILSLCVVGWSHLKGDPPLFAKHWDRVNQRVLRNHSLLRLRHKGLPAHAR